VGHVKR